MSSLIDEEAKEAEESDFMDLSESDERVTSEESSDSQEEEENGQVTPDEEEEEKIEGPVSHIFNNFYL